MVDWDKVIDAFIIIYLLRLVGRKSVECSCVTVPDVPSGAISAAIYGSAVYIYGIPVASDIESRVYASVSDIPVASSIDMNVYISFEEYSG